MKKNLIPVAVICALTIVALVISAPGFSYMKGDVNNDSKIDLTEAVYAIQVSAGTRTTLSSSTINVPVDIPTIQQAIEAAKTGDIVNVAAGTYNETLTINKALTIQGAGKNATIISGVSGTDVISIDGGKVVISGVTLQGGYRGIYACRGSVVEVSDAAVQDVSSHGMVILENSTARVTNFTAQRCVERGIQADRSSSISFYGTISSNDNRKDGISIRNGSSAYFYNANVITEGNAHQSIQIYSNSCLVASGSTIIVRNNGVGNSGDPGSAFTVSSGSSVNINNTSLLIENSGRDGLAVGNNSHFYADKVSPITIRAATRYGIFVNRASSGYFDGNAVLVENNLGNGVHVIEMSAIFILNGMITIQNNAFNGIALDMAELRVEASGTSSNTLTVNGTTTGSGINLRNNSLIYVIGGSLTIENNTGSGGTGISLDSGSQARLSPSGTNSVSIRNNRFGISAWNGGSVTGSGSVTIKGNTDKDVILSFGSRASLPTTSYETISCTGSMTTMGISCP